jgi:hypothetical protein
MKILVRHAGTALYLTSSGEWGPKTSAHEFPNMQVAGQKALSSGDAEVVLSYEQPSRELALNPIYCVQADPPKRQRP